MFKARITVNRDILDALRELPMRAQRNLRHRLVTELRDELQQDTDDLMGQGPTRVDPYIFNTPKSQKFFFWMADITGISSGTPGDMHYDRTGTLERGFRVSVSDRLRENLISIRNIQKSPIPGGKYPPVQRFRGSFVFGKRATIGHTVTGWPEQAELAAQLLSEKAKSRIIEYWNEAVRAALRGRDL